MRYIECGKGPFNSYVRMFMDFLNHIPNYVSKDIFSRRCEEKLSFHLLSPISLRNNQMVPDTSYITDCATFYYRLVDSL